MERAGTADALDAPPRSSREIATRAAVCEVDSPDEPTTHVMQCVLDLRWQARS